MQPVESKTGQPQWMRGAHALICARSRPPEAESRAPACGMMKPPFFSLAAWRSTRVEGGASSVTDFFASPACRFGGTTRRGSGNGALVHAVGAAGATGSGNHVRHTVLEARLLPVRSTKHPPWGRPTASAACAACPAPHHRPTEQRAWPPRLPWLPHVPPPRRVASGRPPTPAARAGQGRTRRTGRAELAAGWTSEGGACG